MTTSTLYPDINPSLLLDFANLKKLDPRITFTRASEGRYYDGKTTAKAEENLFTYSQELNNAAWIVGGVTVTTDTAVAPDGTTTAETLDDDTSLSIHNINQTVILIAGTTYAFSCYFKDVDRQYVILAASTGTNTWASAKFDLTAGTTGSTSASGSGWSVVSSAITSVGNSWYRCSVIFVPGSSATANLRIGLASDGTTFTAGERGLEVYTGTDSTVYVWGAQLEQRSAATAYTPTTTQPITNYVPQLLTAASGVARFDHDPITCESLGLLIEEQRTNLLTYSEDFADVVWGTSTLNVNSNLTVSPSGTLTADKVITSSGAVGSIFQSIAATAAPHTFTVYAKAGEWNWAKVSFVATGNNGAWFNLAAGTIGAVDSGYTAQITPVGNGWHRCSITTTATATNWFGVVLPTNANNTLSTGDGYSGIYIWGAQLEAGAFPTSYIPTTASQVTRSADAASMTGTNFSSWYRQDEGAFFALYKQNAILPSGNFGAVIDVRESSTNRLVLLQNPGTSTNAGLFVVSNGTTAANLTFGLNPNTSARIASAYKFNDFSASFNGGNALGDTSGNLPSPNTLNIGKNGNSVIGTLTIAKIAYYPKRLIDAQLQALTK